MILRVLGNFFLTIEAQKFGKLFGLFGSINFEVETVVNTFLAHFEEIGLLFILPSGHTESASSSRDQIFHYKIKRCHSCTLSHRDHSDCFNQKSL